MTTGSAITDDNLDIKTSFSFMLLFVRLTNNGNKQKYVFFNFQCGYDVA